MIDNEENENHKYEIKITQDSNKRATNTSKVNYKKTIKNKMKVFIFEIKHKI